MWRQLWPLKEQSDLLCCFFFFVFLYEGLFLRVNMILMVILNSMYVKSHYMPLRWVQCRQVKIKYVFLSSEIGGVLLIFFAQSLVPYNKWPDWNSTLATEKFLFGLIFSFMSSPKEMEEKEKGKRTVRMCWVKHALSATYL